MKRKCVLIIITMLVMPMLLSSCNENTGNNSGKDTGKLNLMLNGSFAETERIEAASKESGWTGSISPTGWVITNTFNSKNYIAEVDKKNSVDSDNGSLKIGGKDTVRIIASQSISGLDPERRYCLNGWIKTDNYSFKGTGASVTGPVLQVVATDSNKVFITGKIVADGEVNNLGWTYVEIYFVPGTTDVRIDCHFNSGSGYVWFDDIRLTEEITVVKAGESIISTSVSTDNYDWGSINGKTFQQDGIHTYKGWQYASYYNKERKVCLARRKLPDGEWESFVFEDYTQELDNGHCTISMGICPEDGTIHLTFDHFLTTLNYRVSVKELANKPEEFSWNASSFGPVLHRLEDWDIPRIGYIRFIVTPEDKLQMEYRASGTKGYHRELFWHEYDGKTGEWTFLGKYMDNEASTASVYTNNIMYDKNGRLHVTWVWRDGSHANNHDLCYAYSDDRGRTWYNNAGELIAETGKTFISEKTEGVIVREIPNTHRLSNQDGQFVDSKGRVHVITSHVDIGDPAIEDPGTAPKTYYHYWRDLDGKWYDNKIPVGTTNRGKIVFDKNDNAYAVVTGIVIAAASAEKNWTDWSETYIDDKGRFKEEPVIDFNRLINGDGILSVMLIESKTNNYLCLDYKFKN